MKLPKALLQAMAVGLAMGAVTSCETPVDHVEINPKANIHCEENGTCGGEASFNCPACGMG